MRALNIDEASRRAITRLHLATFLVCLAGLALGPAYLQSFHAQIAGSGLDAVLAQLPPVAWVHARTGLEWLPQLWIGAVLAPLSIFALVMLVEASIRRFGLDRGGDAWSSLCWALRTWRGWLSWLALVALAAAVGVGVAWLLPDLWFVLGFLPPAIVLLATPFMTWNADNLRPAISPALWWPRWPGFVAVAAFVLERVLSWGIDKGLDSADASFAASILVDIALWVPLAIVSVFCLRVWLVRAGLRDGVAHLRAALRPRVLLPVLVQQFRLGAIAVPLLLPVIPFAALMVFVVPQVEDAVRHAGGEPGVTWLALIAAARWVSDWWWCLVLPLPWFVLVAMGRLQVQLGVLHDETPASG